MKTKTNSSANPIAEIPNMTVREKRTGSLEWTGRIARINACTKYTWNPKSGKVFQQWGEGGGAEPGIHPRRVNRTIRGTVQLVETLEAAKALVESDFADVERGPVRAAFFSGQSVGLYGKYFCKRTNLNPRGEQPGYTVKAVQSAKK